MNIVAKRKIFFTIPAIIVVIGIVFAIINGGFNLDIDFSGGTEITIDMVNEKGEAVAFETDKIQNIVEKAGGHAVSTTQSVGETAVMFRFTDFFNETSEEYVAIKDAIKSEYSEVNLEKGISLTSVSATIGGEMVRQSFLICLIAVILMLVYITIRFEFKFGVCSVVALVHDVLIMLSFFAIFRIPVNTSFIAAILTIIGYSINATIVVFDRIRENMKFATRKTDVEALTNKSILSTITRSINTSVTTLLTIVMLHIFVPSIQEFTLPIIVGIFAGAYSSIFIAAPLWSLWKNAGKKKSAQQ